MTAPVRRKTARERDRELIAKTEWLPRCPHSEYLDSYPQVHALDGFYLSAGKPIAEAAARFDECIAAAREPLMRLIEEQAREIEHLRARLKGGTFLPDEVAAKLAAGAGAGECKG